MKKLFLILLIVSFAIMANAQSNPAVVTPDATITDAYYKVAILDTLTDADNDNFVFRLKTSKVMDINIKLYTDFVSGSSSGTLIAAGSIDGVTYANIDTITIASVTADAMDTEVITLNDYNYPYLKVTMAQTGTAVTVPKVWIYGKFN
jgi:hypothetical protein